MKLELKLSFLVPFLLSSASLISPSLVFLHAPIPYVTAVIRQILNNLGLTLSNHLLSLTLISSSFMAPMSSISLGIVSHFLVITFICSSRFPSSLIVISKYWHISVFITTPDFTFFDIFLTSNFLTSLLSLFLFLSSRICLF